MKEIEVSDLEIAVPTTDEGVEIILYFNMRVIKDEYPGYDLVPLSVEFQLSLHGAVHFGKFECEKDTDLLFDQFQEEITIAISEQGYI